MLMLPCTLAKNNGDSWGKDGYLLGQGWLSLGYLLDKDNLKS